MDGRFDARKKIVPWATRFSAVAAVAALASWYAPASAPSRSWSWSARVIPHAHREFWAIGPACLPVGPRPYRAPPRMRTSPSPLWCPSSSAFSCCRFADYPSRWYPIIAVSDRLRCSRCRTVGCCWPRGGGSPTALIAATAPGPRLRLDHGGRASVVDNRELRHPRSRRRRFARTSRALIAVDE